MTQLMEKTELGEFAMTRNVARISDPCYEKDTWCSGTIDNCKIGMWKSKVIKSDEGDWGNRVAYLIAWHEDTKEPNPETTGWNKREIDVGVDSGQAGIFDDYHFKVDESIKGVERIGKEEAICVDEPWYSICCDRTLSDVGAGVIPFGCVSSTGYGDGSYEASSLEKDGEVVAIMIDYGLDYDEDEEIEEELCEGCGGEEQYHDGLCVTCYGKRK